MNRRSFGLQIINGESFVLVLGKRGLAGFDLVGMFWRFLLICVVAGGVFSLYAFSYGYYVDVRDAEAIILAREVSGCLVEDGVLRLDDLADGEDVLGYCGFDEDERFYVGVSVNVSDVEVLKLESGDSSVLWVRDLFDKVDEVSGKGGVVADNVEEVVKSNPGYYLLEHEVVILDNEETKLGKVEIEVLVRSEDE